MDYVIKKSDVGKTLIEVIHRVDLLDENLGIPTQKIIGMYTIRTVCNNCETRGVTLRHYGEHLNLDETICSRCGCNTVGLDE